MRQQYSWVMDNKPLCLRCCIHYNNVSWSHALCGLSIHQSHFFLMVNLKFWSCKNNHPFFFGYKYSIVFSYSILSVTSWFLKPCARLGISAHWKAQVNSRLSLFDGKSNKILEIYGWKVLFLMKNIRCTMMFSIKIPEWVQSMVKGWVSYLNWLVVNYLLLSQLIFLFSYLPRSN